MWRSMRRRCRNGQESNYGRHNIEGYVIPNGKTLFVLADGRLVNLASGDGHPAEIMDMSFAVQAMSAKYQPTTARSFTPASSASQ